MRKRRIASTKVTVAQAVVRGREDVRRELERFAALDARAADRLRRDGWSVVVTPPARVYSAARLFEQYRRLDLSVEAVDPNEIVGERVDFEFKRFAEARLVTVPLAMLREAEGLAKLGGVVLRRDPLEPFRADRTRDPGRARQVLREHGWSNREIKRVPLGRLRRLAFALWPVRVRLLVEATFALVDGVPNVRRQIVVPAGSRGGLIFALVQHAIRTGERFMVGAPTQIR